MSGSPYTYDRSMAIAQLMIDNRRPVMKEIAKEKAPYNVPQRVYKYGDDFFVSFQDTIDWVPKLAKVGPNGEAWGGIIKGWPTEEEIAACIAESAEAEKNWNGSLSANDRSAFNRRVG